LINITNGVCLNISLNATLIRLQEAHDLSPTLAQKYHSRIFGIVQLGAKKS